jgi:hypothetical protein
MRCHSFQGASEKISTCEKGRKAIQEAIQDVVAMLAKKNKVRSSQ